MEKSSVLNPTLGKRMRELVIAVGGPLEAGENRKGWLYRVAVRAEISVRVAAAAFYGEQMSKETENKLKAAAGKHEAEILARRFENLAQSLRHGDSDFHVEGVAACIHAVRVLRGLGGAGDHS